MVTQPFRIFLADAKGSCLNERDKDVQYCKDVEEGPLNLTLQ